MGRPPQVTDGHLRRGAEVYVRQSSDAQVRSNTGSTELQRDAVALALAWGWAEEAIHLREGDLGASADAPNSREEFNQLLTDMSAGRVGVVFVSQHSRISRNEVDAAVFSYAARLNEVLLVVGYQVFDFTDPNSAFMAGMLGLSAILEHRSKTKFGTEAKRRKARQGVAPSIQPVGIVRTPGGGLDVDPDERIQEPIRLVFTKFLELRSANRVVGYLREKGIQLPRRMPRGGTRWVDATPSRVLGVLRNPAYAGTYIYGKTAVDYTGAPSKKGRRRRRQLPPNEWIILENHHRGYIAQHQWAEIQDILSQNRSTSSGSAAGRGESLAQGRLICAEHQTKLYTKYSSRQRQADGSILRVGRYCCTPNQDAGNRRECCGIGSPQLDTVVEAELLKVLAPPSLEIIQQTAWEALRQYEALGRAREDELHRAERASARLEEEFLRTDASLSSVKGRLGKLWEDARQHHADLQHRHRLRPLPTTTALTESEIAELRDLLRDLPALWRHPVISPQQRKTILRLLIQAIRVTPGPESWTLDIEWAGGARSQATILTRTGVAKVVEREHMNGRSTTEIMQQLAERGAPMFMRIDVPKRYPADAVHRIVRRVRREHGLDGRAYRYIHDRILKGTPYRRIAQELNDSRILNHYDRKWTKQSVARAVFSMRTRSVHGLERLPSVVPLSERVAALHAQNLGEVQIAQELRRSAILTMHRMPVTVTTVRQILRRLGRPVIDRRRGRRRVDTSLDTAIRRLWAETPALADVTRSANERGIRTRRGNLWRSSMMSRKLASLDLRESRKRGLYRQNRRTEGMVSELPYPGTQAAGKKALLNRQDSLW
jgi:DNA invertase Pin-like site-specific DNA recombinase